jgi:hypothetical protein
MSDQHTDETSDGYSRRRYLAAVGAAGTVALAGCSGGGDGSDGSDGSDGDGSDGGDGSDDQTCPSPPFSFAEYGAVYPMTEDTDPLITFEAPEGDGFTATVINQEWSLEYGPRRNRLSVRPERVDGTIEQAVNTRVSTDLSDQYDVPQGARVLAGASPEDVIPLLRVLLPTESDGEFVRVQIGLTSTQNCPEVAETVQDRIVDSVALA